MGGPQSLQFLVREVMTRRKDSPGQLTSPGWLLFSTLYYIVGGTGEINCRAATQEQCVVFRYMPSTTPSPFPQPHYYTPAGLLHSSHTRTACNNHILTMENIISSASHVGLLFT
ncbi:hypothetical protein E2C01_027818 [Portunus trituberculatus]|uniref:Uncharacterized protein n=1 Tax=Portunus trituberculatus TaxID=210409 RepID=A0A5B7EM73_PORTR|nr:hypothetical protein [Portunus trituberculatus]